MELTEKQIEHLAIFEACNNGCIGMIRYIKMHKPNFNVSYLREAFIQLVEKAGKTPESYRKILNEIGQDFGVNSKEEIEGENYFFLGGVAERTKKPFDEHFSLIKKAAKCGHVEACKYVASQYIYGNWVEDIRIDRVKARKYIDFALNKGQNNPDVGKEFETYIKMINAANEMERHRESWLKSS
jgi:TPR repeat protein